MNETTLTMGGNLVADPALRYTPSGAVVVNLRIASTEWFKGEGGWQDGDTLFMTVTAWRTLAENVAEPASKGTRVIVTGRPRQRSYDTRGGGRATVYGLDATDVGISLQRTTAKPARAECQDGGNGGEPEQACTRRGDRHERYGPARRPCYGQAKATDEPSLQTGPNLRSPSHFPRRRAPPRRSDLQATAPRPNLPPRCRSTTHRHQR